MYNSSGSLSYLLDPSGQFLGGAWTGGSISSVSLGNRLMAQYLSDGAHFSHANVLGSETQTTD
ncbi:MAG TPA: hypothetical protein VG204_20245 [Terriglobia bacterium]|nr:hypothetical protein [Terriglobia bacterium]